MTVLADMDEGRRLLSLVEDLDQNDINLMNVTSLVQEVSHKSLPTNSDHSDPLSPNENNHSMTRPHNHGVSGLGLNIEDFDSHVKEHYSPNNLRLSPQGSASQTTESRELRRAKAARNEFNRRITHLPATYLRRLQVLSVLVLALVCLSLGYSNELFKTVTDSVQHFLTTTEIGRTAIAVAQAARLMALFGNAGDTSRFQYWRNDLKKKNDLITNVALPFLTARSSMTVDVAQVFIYDRDVMPAGVNDVWSGQPRFDYLNQFQVASAVNDNARKLLLENISYFQSHPPTGDNRVRFLIDNVLTIGENLKAVCDVGEEEFHSVVSGKTMVLMIILILQVLAVLSLALFVFSPLVFQLSALQVRYMRHLQGVSKRAVDAILVEIDEQLEFLTEDGEMDVNTPTPTESTSSNKSVKRLAIVGAAIVIAGGCLCAVVVPVLAVLPENTSLVGLVNYSGGRKFYHRAVRTLAWEVLIGDSTTWLRGEAEAVLSDTIDKLEDLHRNALTGHGKREIPPISSIPVIQNITSGGVCLTESCDPADRMYNASFGYTYETVTAPIGQMITEYIAVARKLLLDNGLRATHNWDDPSIMFMEATQQDIVNGLLAIDQLILEQYLPQVNDQARGASQGVFVAAVVMFGVCYVWVFKRLVDQRRAEMEVIVCLLHTIPQGDMNANASLARLIRSGGAILGDEE
ncbi:hypothetical protein M427DRAFT_53071 [Gonapodya prolifera JEL478]|uniref:Uncharacterized protein n=1 Tax=Gonapodya prolifera (strain JEL478) TaxID=1344416 RepID=A0A139AQQ0_GONPJ|nr:hypothetical protein M427DRAFT_53071 [Gonapodya prolifera JEL478]|eukprot:KXS19080.1 hypothetical protein M427DRAFT_53071 [Gonapodya prolifera JEL478]